MTEAEEEELTKLRNERNSDGRRRNAFYGGNQEAEKKKIGLDPREAVAEAPLSNSGISTTSVIRCTLGVRIALLWDLFALWSYPLPSVAEAQ